jgi:penicillin-binding protein 2
MSLHVTEAQRQALRTRLNYLLLFGLFAFAFLGARFWVLQIIQYQEWNAFAEDKQIRKVRITPSRGNISDCNGKVLAYSEPGYDVTVVPADVREEAIALLAEILEMSPEQIKDRIKKNSSWSPFIPALVAENIDRTNVLPRIRVNWVRLPGVEIEERPVRRYNEDSILVSHILGYLGEINQAELSDPDNQGYRMGDQIGKSGLERSLEKELRGRFGFEYKLQDARGREITPESTPVDMRAQREYEDKLNSVKAMRQPMVPGHSVVLTLDIALTRQARKRLGDQVGSVVVMDVRTGELKCLLSNPGYDPALFVNGISPQTWEELRDSPWHPLFNRALQGAYPPASVFKIVMAAGALEDRVVTPEQKYHCEGTFHFGSNEFRCWNKNGHGRIDLMEAIVVSCDVYFYKLGVQEMGIERIDRIARRFGLGQALLNGLLPEDPGLVPNPEWKKRVKNKSWYPGETILISIGQGYLKTTPLQAVLIPAVVANKGRLMQPQLIDHFEDVHGRPLNRYTPRVLAENLLHPDTVRILHQAMTEVVNSPRGTAYKYARSDLVKIAGKTGTAEVGKQKYRNVPVEEIPYKSRDHAWFVGYAPADDPQIAVAVLVEHGGGGGQTAGPIARAIIEDYFFPPKDQAAND